MIEEEKDHETTGNYHETIENGIIEIKTNENDTEMNIGAISNKLQDIIGLLDLFKSQHSLSSPEEKIELLKLNSSIGSKILDL